MSLLPTCCIHVLLSDSHPPTPQQNFSAQGLQLCHISHGTLLGGGGKVGMLMTPVFPPLRLCAIAS